MGLKGFVLISSLLFALLGVWVYIKFIKTEPSPVFQLKDGKVQGIRLKSREGRDFYAFYGLPFAKPPIGELRFEPPVPNEPWEETWDATYLRSICAQAELMVSHSKWGSEDCLYANVYRPANTPKSKKLPVLVYIHGGYFHVGSGAFSGAHYFMDHEVILVTINYRLGALGFLNTGDSLIRGNMGLKDQNMALRWVQRNIEGFGGDKSKVTIMGESAGGASVGYQMLSPLSKGLFWRAIAESGSPLNYWTMYRDVKKQSQNYAKNVNCPTDSSKKMVECLKALDTDAILTGHNEMEKFPYYPFIAKFVPTIETVKDNQAFLTEVPLELMKTGKYNIVKLMTGFAADEGLLHSIPLWFNETKLNEVDDWNSWAPKALHYDKSRTDVSQKLKDFYLGKNAKNLNSLKYFQQITDMYGDRLFNIGVAQTALIQRKFNPVYSYVLEHQAGFSFSLVMEASEAKYHPVLTIIAERLQWFYTSYILGEKYHYAIKGTCHADENMLLYYNPIAPIYHNDEDVKMSKALVQLWVDFASGKDKLTFQGTEWVPNIGTEQSELKFLKLNLTHPKMIPEPFKERRLFWEQNIDLVPE